MKRPTDREAMLEAALAEFVPAAPAADLRRRVAEALAAPAVKRPAPGGWLAERLGWACGGAAVGAVAASLAFTLRPAADMAPIQATASAASRAASVVPSVEVAEQSVAWADAGVQFLDDRTPAQVLRRVAVERHRPADGGEYLVPREDVILVPVALR